MSPSQLLPGSQREENTYFYKSDMEIKRQDLIKMPRKESKNKI